MSARLVNVPLAERTTLRLGGPADELWEVTSEVEIAEALQELDGSGRPALVLGGGSNMVVADAGFRGVVVALMNRGLRVERGEGGVRLTAQGGEPWSAVTDVALAEGCAGVECLVGIPGLAGATPVQNVGAYGQQIADTLVSLRAYDREARAVVDLPAARCAFAYRTSTFKHSTRWVITSVVLELPLDERSRPVRYPELARALGLREGERDDARRVAQTVLALRRGKGMVLDPQDPESKSAGSFFTNPLVDDATLARLSGEAPRFREGDRWKVPAAWLLERAGFTKGYGAGRVGVSHKHALALVNRGGGTSGELIALAREMQEGVRLRFGVTLTPEPVLVGVTL